MDKIFLIDHLSAIMEIIASEDIEFTSGSKMLSELINNVRQSEFPVAAIGHEGRERLLARLQSINDEARVQWEHLNVKIYNLETQNTAQLLGSKAFLFVADAVHIFSQKERAILAALLGDRPPYQVVVAVNNIQYVEEPNEVKDWVRKVLNPHFLDETGKLDDTLYNQHVCFVDSRDISSIQQLHSQLNTIFHDDDKRMLAESAAATQVALYIVEASKEHIGHLILSNKKNLENLGATHQHFGDQQRERRLLLQKLEDIQERIRSKVYRSLVRYIDKMDTEWENHASDIIDPQMVDLKELWRVFVSEKQFEAFQIKINRNIQNYLRMEFQKWGNQLGIELATDFSELNHLQIQINTLETRKLTNTFASSRYQTLNKSEVQTLIQQMSQRILLGGRSLDQTILKLLVRATLLYVLLFSRITMLRLSGFLAILGSETINTKQELISFRKGLLEQLRRELIGSLRRALTKPELLFISSAATDQFMTIVSERNLPITDLIFTSLGSANQQILKKSQHSDTEKSQFAAELNTALQAWDACDPEAVNDSISPETKHTILKDPDKSRGYRLLLAETFPEHIYQNLQDILYSHIDFQISSGFFPQETDNTSSLTLTLSPVENELLTRQDVLNRTLAKLQECFDNLTVSVYGSSYKPEEMRANYERKSFLFGNLSNES